MTQEEIEALQAKVAQLEAEANAEKEKAQKLADEIAKKDKLMKDFEEVAKLKIAEPKKEEELKKVEEPKKEENVLEYYLQQKAKLEAEEAEKIKNAEHEKLLKRVKELEAKEKITNILSSDPYLKDYVEESIKLGRNLDEIDATLSPSLKKDLKIAYEYKQSILKAGGDPMEIYSNMPSVNDELARKKAYDQKVADWGKLL